MLGEGQRDDLTVHYRQDPVDAAIRAIHRALDLGIDFFDTADVYGGGHSVRTLGQALAGRRHQVVLATKFGESFDEQAGRHTEEEPSPTYIRRACQASLRRLDTDYIGLYLLHLRDYDLERAGEVRHTLEALGWIWARSPRTAPVPGFRTLEQVEDDAEVLRLGLISEEQMQEIRHLKLDSPSAGSSQ